MALYGSVWEMQDGGSSTLSTRAGHKRQRRLPKR
jgi:hypothetical protein